MNLGTSVNKALLITSVLLTFFLLAPSVNAQFVNSGFTVDSTDIYKDILKHITDNPDSKSEKFAEYANSLVESKGINYSFALDHKICDLVDGEFAKKTNAGLNELFLRGSFALEKGNATILKFRILRKNRGPCGRCLVKLPLAVATNQYFMLILKGQMINFRNPKGFEIDQVDLLDKNDSSKIKHSWRVPFRSKPIGISWEGTILYVEIKDKNLNQLALEVFSNGVIRFVAKNTLDLKETGATVQYKGNDNLEKKLSYLSFGKGKERQTIRYSAPCTQYPYV